jgi:hypothetical protein
MQHIHENNGKTFLFLTVPNGATDPYIVGGYYEKNKLTLAFLAPRYTTIELSSGNWQIFCKGDEATEVQAKEIVQPVRKDFYIGYKEYVNDDGCYVTALESFHSLLHSINMQPETTLILQQIVS